MTHCWRAVNILGEPASSYVRVSEWRRFVKPLHAILGRMELGSEESLRPDSKSLSRQAQDLSYSRPGKHKRYYFCTYTEKLFIYQLVNSLRKRRTQIDPSYINSVSKYLSAYQIRTYQVQERCSAYKDTNKQLFSETAAWFITWGWISCSFITVPCNSPLSTSNQHL